MPFDYHSRKYQLDEFFFSKWSRKMSYVLGFWWADGYMRHDRSYRVDFASNDESHLKNIATLLSSTTPVVQYSCKGILENCFHLTVHSKRLFQDLQILGGNRKKSLTLTFPKIPNKLLADFIRGYFDGDGSVYFVTYLRSKDRRKQIDFRSSFTSGSSSFLNSLRDTLTLNVGLFPRKVCAYGEGNQWKLEYATKDTYKLMTYLYNNLQEILYLKRKYLIYKNHLDSQAG